jgi:energy-coupling factor transporter ATP-binding protein EcfA2
MKPTLPAVTIEDLTFTYKQNQNPALKNLNAHIEEGSFVCILGHGGAGKSSLCYSLNGLIPNFFKGTYKGKVLVKGLEAHAHKVAHLSTRVGLVLQDFEAQLFSTNVELEMAFGPENHGLPVSEIEGRITKYLGIIGLDPFRKREPATLSGGQKQRLAIGSILALEPEILVMDEPTTDLDPRGAEEVLSLAGSLRRQGRTMVMVVPEPEMALEADQVWLMRNGEIATQGPPEEVLSNLAEIRRCGIKPPSFIELFQALEWPGQPLTLERTLALIEEKGLSKNQKSFKPLEGELSKTSTHIIKTEGLNYSYSLSEQKALDGVDLNIGEGEFVALLGQNGSGKTTLAKHFNGLLKSGQGGVWIEGKPISEYSHKTLAQKVGYVFQNPDHQIFARTVWEEVGFTLKMLGVEPSSIEKRVDEVLEIVGLQGYQKKIPFTLTKGERQRVAVASVLAAQPQVIILDEPTTGLDYAHQKNMMELLRSLNQKGHTIVIITHSMWVAAEYAVRTIVMKKGTVLMDGPTGEVFSNEEKLNEASLSPPPLVQLRNRLGLQGLTLAEMVMELKSISPTAERRTPNVFTKP